MAAHRTHMAVNVDVARAGNGQVGTVDIGVGKVNVARTGDFHDKLLRSNAVNADVATASHCDIAFAAIEAAQLNIARP